MVGLALLAAPACSGPGDGQGDGNQLLSSSSASPSAQAAQAAVTDEELATTVVRVAPSDAAGNACSWGSGTVLSPDGTILTNFHVVEYDPDSDCDYQQLVISVTDASDSPPTPTYVADVHAFDPDADLAVLRIAGGIHGEAVTPNLHYVEVGDSDTVEIGSTIKVFGYPEIGGETITLTEGTVSGFLSSPEVTGGHAWIKTATTIAGGNSGGAAFDPEGRLIGIPTRASASTSGRMVDCRIIEDTNGDGWIDENDSCVPIGGFLNSLRPVNLAQPLLDRAQSAGPIALTSLVREPTIASESPSEQPSEEPTDEPTYSPSIGTIAFSSDIDEDGNAVDSVVTLPSGASSICASFDYEGMVDGSVYDLVWSLDGEMDNSASVVGGTWSGGPTGSWYICVRGDQDGVPDGLWELAIYLNSEEPYRTGTIYVGDGHPQVDVQITNGLDERICYLYVAADEATRWGPDRLGEDFLEPGESAMVSVGASTYDFRGSNCNDEELVQVDDVDVQESATVLLQ